MWAFFFESDHITPVMRRTYLPIKIKQKQISYAYTFQRKSQNAITQSPTIGSIYHSNNAWKIYTLYYENYE